MKFPSFTDVKLNKKVGKFRKEFDPDAGEIPQRKQREPGITFGLVVPRSPCFCCGIFVFVTGFSSYLGYSSCSGFSNVLIDASVIIYAESPFSVTVLRVLRVLKVC